MRKMALVLGVLALGFFSGCSRMMTRSDDDSHCLPNPCDLKGEHAVVNIEVLDCCSPSGMGKSSWWGGTLKFDSDPKLLLHWSTSKTARSYTGVSFPMVRVEIDETRTTPENPPTVEWVSCAERRSCCKCGQCETRPPCNHNRSLSDGSLKQEKYCVAVLRISSAQLERDVNSKLGH